MTKKVETPEVIELKAKHTDAINHYEKLNNTLAKVTAKVERLEQDMAKFIFACKDAEKEFRTAEKKFLREEITKTDLDEIAKKQEDGIKRMHDAERSLSVAKQVIDEINHEIRTAIEGMNVARKRLCAAIRADLISQIPADLEEHLLKICATYPEPFWEGVLSETFPAPHREKVKAAQAELNKRLKS